jgi:DNA-binding FadR family transcriptional regulator
MFAPLEQLSRAETVTRRLADAIALGLLADQEQLPSESELANRFGVSTVTVREALAALRQQGLVETRRGRSGGSFVCAPTEWPSSSLVTRLRELTLSDIRDIGDHYLTIAGGAARLAAERSSTEDVARMRSAIDESTHGHGLTWPGAERRFHLEIAAATQSPRLTQQEVRIQTEVGVLLWLPVNQEEDRQRVTAEHRNILTAISDNDGERARELTESHVVDAVERLAELHLRLVES